LLCTSDVVIALTIALAVTIAIAFTNVIAVAIAITVAITVTNASSSRHLHLSSSAGPLVASTFFQPPAVSWRLVSFAAVDCHVVLLQLLLPSLLLLSSKAMSQYFMRNPMAFLKQQSACPIFFGMLTTSLINVTQ
jgi:hypothetical protein